MTDHGCLRSGRTPCDPKRRQLGVRLVSALLRAPPPLLNSSGAAGWGPGGRVGWATGVVTLACLLPLLLRGRAGPPGRGPHRQGSQRPRHLPPGALPRTNPGSLWDYPQWADTRWLPAPLVGQETATAPALPTTSIQVRSRLADELFGHQMVLLLHEHLATRLLRPHPSLCPAPHRLRPWPPQMGAPGTS